MMKFNPGQLVVTRGVHNLMESDDRFRRFVQLSFNRHLAGDWGDLSDDDRIANELALKDDDRILSVYLMEGMPKLWIITEADRSVTTALLPDEY